MVVQCTFGSGYTYSNCGVSGGHRFLAMVPYLVQDRCECWRETASRKQRANAVSEAGPCTHAMSGAHMGSWCKEWEDAKMTLMSVWAL